MNFKLESPAEFRLETDSADGIDNLAYENLDTSELEIIDYGYEIRKSLGQVALLGLEEDKYHW